MHTCTPTRMAAQRTYLHSAFYCIYYIYILQQTSSFLSDPTPPFSRKPRRAWETSKSDSANFQTFSQNHEYLIESHVTKHNGGNMAMMVKQGREVQTCLLTHNVRLEMQMAKLAMTPPASGCQAWSWRVENVPQSKC